MDFSNLFGGSDNFFKYMTIGGLILIIIGLMYPLQKKQELDIDIETSNKNIELFKYEYNTTYKSIVNLTKETYYYKQNIDSLKKGGSINNGRIENLKKEYFNKKKNIDDKYNELNIKDIMLKHDANRIEILKSHLQTYSRYSTTFLIVGSVLALICGFLWMRSSIYDDKIKRKTLDTP